MMESTCCETGLLDVVCYVESDFLRHVPTVLCYAYCSHLGPVLAPSYCTNAIVE